MSVFELIVIALLAALVLCAVVAIIVALSSISYKKSKKGQLEARFLFDSQRIVWRLVNCGYRNITIVEIGIICGGKIASYRPLFSQNEEVNSIPYIIGNGEIASFRKEMEKFRFRQADVAALKIQNPFMTLYVKDAEGTIYEMRSEVRFLEYLDRISSDRISTAR